MKPAPLTLRSYAVLDHSIAANLDFKPEEPVRMHFEDFCVESDYAPSSQPIAQWQLVLKIQQKPNAANNLPYHYTLRLIGFLDVDPAYPENGRDQLIRVNGSSMLYGAAREIIRVSTSQGPYRAVLIPSVSFYPKKETSPERMSEKKETL